MFQLIGITEQLVGTHWPGVLPFRYVGSIGPLEISGPLRAELTRVGSLLRNEFHLRGIFGVDAIIRDESVWIIEVNPRYTASVEILEQTLNVDSLTLHVSSCRGETISKDRLPKVSGKYGKAIYYAREPLTITEADHQWMVRHHRENENFLQIADIPLPGFTYINSPSGLYSSCLGTFARGSAGEAPGDRRSIPREILDGGRRFHPVTP